MWSQTKGSKLLSIIFDFLVNDEASSVKVAKSILQLFVALLIIA